jgi:hypothetical protein
MQRRPLLGSFVTMLPFIGGMLGCATRGDTTLRLDKGQPVWFEFPDKPERSGFALGSAMLTGLVGAVIDGRRDDVYKRGQEFLNSFPPEKSVDFAVLFRQEFLKEFLAKGGLLAQSTGPRTVTVGFSNFSAVYVAYDAFHSFHPSAMILITASNDQREITKGYGRAVLGRNPKAPEYATFSALLEHPDEVMENLKLSVVDMAQRCAQIVAAAQSV